MRSRSNQSQGQRCIQRRHRRRVCSPYSLCHLTAYCYLSSPTTTPIASRSAVNSVVYRTSAFGILEEAKLYVYAIVPSLRRRTRPPPAHDDALSSLPSVQPLLLPYNNRLSTCLSAVEQRPFSASWSCCASNLISDSPLATRYTDRMPRLVVMVLAERLRY